MVLYFRFATNSVYEFGVAPGAVSFGGPEEQPENVLYTPTSVAPDDTATTAAPTTALVNVLFDFYHRAEGELERERSLPPSRELRPGELERERSLPPSRELTPICSASPCTAATEPGLRADEKQIEMSVLQSEIANLKSLQVDLKTALRIKYDNLQENICHSSDDDWGNWTVEGHVEQPMVFKSSSLEKRTKEMDTLKKQYADTTIRLDAKELKLSKISMKQKKRKKKKRNGPSLGSLFRQ